MSQPVLQLLNGFLGLLKLADLLTSLPGLALTLWFWLHLTLPCDTAIGLWLSALALLMLAKGEEVKG